MVPKCALCLLVAFAAAFAFAQRQSITLTEGWRFHLQDAPGAEQPNFDDASWQRIALPHTWNNIDGQEHDSYYRGVGWYRLHLSPPSSMSGKSLFLRFEAAATVADVYVNGRELGEHRGNFGAFCFEASPFLQPGKDNVIAVKVDNSKFADVPPLSGDFTVFGGIYRPVHLLALNPISIDPLDYASPGIYLTPERVSPQEAVIRVGTLMRNETGAPANVSVRCSIRDSRREFVAESEKRVQAQDGEIDEQVRIPRPHFWDGVNNPYLYRATVEIRQGGKVLDSEEQPLGIRTFRVDPNEGLILNGRHYELHGVSRHQDRLNKGWAISAADHRQDFEMIREMGCTGIRLAHYQHAEDFYRLCDEGGLVVWAEIPLINSLNYTEAFTDNARSQLNELIKQNYNHPSIFFWSLFNELSFPSGAKNPQEWQLIVELNGLAHKLDPNRLTTAATSLPVSHPVNFITDVIGVNRYYGWYSGKPDDWARELDSWHAKYPRRAFAVSEYGAGASIHQHEFNPKQPKTNDPWHPEEWQCVVHEDAFGAMKTRHWLWGTFIWNMFDFGVASRNEGDTPGRNDKGMATYDRKTRKDAFFFYQANLTSKPMAYIAERRFTPRPSGPQTIKAYSNCPSLTLYINGKSMGEVRAPDHVFTWQVDLPEGADRLEVVGDGARDECEVQGRFRG